MLKKILAVSIITCAIGFVWAYEDVNLNENSSPNLNVDLKEDILPLYSQKTVDSDIDIQIEMINLKIEQIDREIERTERELRNIPGPNWVAGCLWIGCVLGLPGAVVWYFTDIKPKSDQRADLKDKIARLQGQRENLENQLMQLRMQKK